MEQQTHGDRPVVTSQGLQRYQQHMGCSSRPHTGSYSLRASITYQQALAGTAAAVGSTTDNTGAHSTYTGHSKSSNISQTRPSTGALQDTVSSQQPSSSRPHSRLQAPPQQQDTCVVQQQHYQRRSSLEHQTMSPGHIQRPGSRLGHHEDMREPYQCHQQQRHIPSNTGSCPADAARDAGQHAAPAYQYVNRQHSSRGSGSGTGCYNTECSAQRPGSPSKLSGGNSSNRPASRQQQQQVPHLHRMNSNCSNAVGLEAISEQHVMPSANCANPLYANHSSAAVLMATSSSTACTAAQRIASAAASPAGLHSPLPTPRRAGTGSSVDFGNANTAHSGTSTRPSSSAAGVAGSYANSNQTPRRADSSASVRPSSRQLSSTYKPQAGVLSQDPAPVHTAGSIRKSAASLGGHDSSSSASSNRSRPSSAATRSAAAAGGIGKLPVQPGELQSPFNQPQQQQQTQVNKHRLQSAVGPAVSVLATPRNHGNRPMSSSHMHRPGRMAAMRPGTSTDSSNQQQQQVLEASGPLLSDYFRPPSAAAPGCVGLFGLPGMEPPAGLTAAVVPSVRVPSVHASWDATVAGLSSSGSIIGIPALAQAAAAVPEADAVPSEQQQVQPSQSDITQLIRQDAEMHGSDSEQAVRPGSTQADAVRPGTSSRRQRPNTVGRVIADAAESSKQQLLLWSAAHEIDGRPVTRNGERARPHSRGV